MRNCTVILAASSLVFAGCTPPSEVGDILTNEEIESIGERFNPSAGAGQSQLEEAVRLGREGTNEERTRYAEEKKEEISAILASNPALLNDPRFAACADLLGQLDRYSRGENVVLDDALVDTNDEECQNLLNNNDLAPPGDGSETTGSGEDSTDTANPNNEADDGESEREALALVLKIAALIALSQGNVDLAQFLWTVAEAVEPSAGSGGGSGDGEGAGDSGTGQEGTSYDGESSAEAEQARASARSGTYLPGTGGNLLVELREGSSTIRFFDASRGTDSPIDTIDLNQINGYDDQDHRPNNVSSAQVDSNGRIRIFRFSTTGGQRFSISALDNEGAGIRYQLAAD